MDKKTTDHEKRITELEQQVARLKDQLNTKDNWHAEVQTMINKEVVISVRGYHGGREGVNGKLLWSDRYNLCIEDTIKERAYRTVYMKGSVISIRLLKQ